MKHKKIVLDSEIMQEEIASAIKSLPNQKAPGP